MNNINATVRINREDWETLKEKAESLQMNRTKLLTLIARGQISMSQIVLKEQEKSLIKFVAQLIEDCKDQLAANKRQISFYQNQVEKLEKRITYLENLALLYKEDEDDSAN